MSLSKSLAAKIQALEPNSKETRAKLHLIGNVLANRMKMNALQKRIRGATGALSNSITYKIYGNSVEVGSFGVKYAKYHEFGAELPRNAVRAMFASFKGRKRPSKNVMIFNSDGSAILTARPFVRPALISERQRVLDILRSSF